MLNGHRFARSQVTLLMNDTALEMTVDGLDYGDGATASIYLPAGGERDLIGRMGVDPFRGSFDINVSYSTTDTGPLTEDRLTDCRLRGTGYRPMPLSVLHVKRGFRRSGGPV
jgi:hypothetical protein